MKLVVPKSSLHLSLIFRSLVLSHHSMPRKNVYQGDAAPMKKKRAKSTTKRQPNAWARHVKEYAMMHPGLGKMLFKEAAKTWHSRSRKRTSEF